MIEAGSISALYMYLKSLTDSFMAFGGQYDSVVREKTNILNAEALENIKIEKNTKNNSIFKNWKNIIIKNLDFNYNIFHKNQSSKNLNIKIENLKVEKNKKIAIIGESGGGKTTFLKVLHGLYSNTKSNIYIDGINKQTNFMDININSTLVPQEPELFSSTILENITFGVDFSKKEIYKILEIVQIEDFIKRLPNKLNSKINEKGVNLSGGQKQRIALARALLFAQNKELILLDESTSSVDPENEEAIYKNIFKYFSNTTFIASIHKMNLLKYFDEIIIFDNGAISDSGTFKYLLENNAKFKKNWNLHNST
jgi:ABC-type multidrug transport system fused ATPase/permease subunit